MFLASQQVSSCHAYRQNAAHDRSSGYEANPDVPLCGAQDLTWRRKDDAILVEAVPDAQPVEVSWR